MPRSVRLGCAHLRRCQRDRASLEADLPGAPRIGWVSGSFAYFSLDCHAVFMTIFRIVLLAWVSRVEAVDQDGRELLFCIFEPSRLGRKPRSERWHRHACLAPVNARRDLWGGLGRAA